MNRPIAVEPRGQYRIWLRYADGSDGEIDLSDLAGRGVFQAWEDPSVFEAVRIGESGAIEWPGGLDLCPDAMYMRLSGKSAEELFPALDQTSVDA